MLRELKIKNLAIIDDLTVEFKNGLNVLTGETGAGKSIIVDSLSLCLGARAQSDLIRAGEREAIVQAYFEIEDLKELFHKGISISDNLIIRRSISSSGKSRAYINDTMVTLQTLSEISKSIVDIHGQHEHQSLLSTDKQLFFIDSYGKLQYERKSVESLYKKFQELKKEEVDLKQKIKERSHKLDLLRFQINEIDASNLKIGEKEELIKEKTILSNVAKLQELAEITYSMLYSAEGSCIEKLSSVISKVKEMSSMDKDTSDILNTLESTLPLIEDSAISLRKYKDKYNFNPERLSEIEERLDLIKKLEMKYGEGIETILQYRDNAKQEMKSLELTDERLSSIEAECKETEEKLLKAAYTLSEKRKDVARKIEKLVQKEFNDLALDNAKFLIGFQQDTITNNGIDKIEFLFSANPGEPPKPLIKIASGGELSRVMLTLKSILADFDNIPILIFDEVDAGIGGKTAESVGKKLKMLSKKHQVLCTTHLPQIASKGDFHLKIEKRQRDERVHVSVKSLEQEQRLEEIARMLSGKITDVSRKHAKELIDSSVYS